MGVNIYMKRIPTKAELDAIKKKIDDLDFYDAKEDLENLITNTEVHIGKCSMGWQFLFAPNPDYYTENRKSIDQFLRESGKGDWILKNEYGDTVDPDVFWDLYVDSHKDLYTLESYYKDHPEESNDYWVLHEHISKDGLRISSTADFG